MIAYVYIPNVIRCNNVRPEGVALGPNLASSTVVSLELFRTPASNTTTTTVPLRSCSRGSPRTSTTGRRRRDTKSSYRPSPTERKKARKKTEYDSKSQNECVSARSTLVEGGLGPRYTRCETSRGLSSIQIF